MQIFFYKQLSCEKSPGSELDCSARQGFTAAGPAAGCLVELMDAASSLQVLVVLCYCWAADVSRAFSPGDTGFVDGEDHPVYYTQGKELRS